MTLLTRWGLMQHLGVDGSTGWFDDGIDVNTTSTSSIVTAPSVGVQRLGISDCIEACWYFQDNPENPEIMSVGVVRISSPLPRDIPVPTGRVSEGSEIDFFSTSKTTV